MHFNMDIIFLVMIIVTGFGTFANMYPFTHTHTHTQNIQNTQKNTHTKHTQNTHTHTHTTHTHTHKTHTHIHTFLEMTGCLILNNHE